MAASKNESSMPVMHGSCACGDIEVKVFGIDFGDGERRSHICHCSACKRGSGSHYAHNLDLPTSQLAIEGRGELQSWTTRDSDPKIASTRFFCKRCGCTIANSSPEQPAILCLRMGLFPDVPHPVSEILPWQKLPWLRDKLEGLRNETFAEGDVPPLVKARMEARLH